MDRFNTVYLLQLAVTLLLATTLLAGLPTPARAQSSPTAEPFVIEFYYKAKWGYATEFIELYKKNHYPILAEQVSTGRMLSVRADQPRYHATEDGRWDYRVTITFHDLQAAFDATGEDEIIKRLYPDRELFEAEEQRRFEILEAHWDVPVLDVDLDE